jgi:hypothetical protein
MGKEEVFHFLNACFRGEEKAKIWCTDFHPSSLYKKFNN